MDNSCDSLSFRSFCAGSFDGSFSDFSLCQVRYQKKYLFRLKLYLYIQIRIILIERLNLAFDSAFCLSIRYNLE